jgi:hypothetical protein
MRARGMTGRQLLPRIEELAAVFRAGLAVLDELRSAVTGEPRQPTLTRRPFPSLPPIPPLSPLPRYTEDETYALPFGSGSGSFSDRMSIAGNVGGSGGEQNQNARPRAKPRTSWPSDFTLTDERRRYAERNGLDAEYEWGKFQAHAERDDVRYANWPAAWQYWVRNAWEMAPRQGRR